MTRELRAALLGLSAYKALREEPLLKAVGNLLDGLAAGRGEEALGAYTDVVLALQEAGAHGMGDGLLALLRYREPPYPRALTGPAGWERPEAAARAVLRGGAGEADRPAGTGVRSRAGGAAPLAGGGGFRL